MASPTFKANVLAFFKQLIKPFINNKQLARAWIITRQLGKLKRWRIIMCGTFNPLMAFANDVHVTVFRQPLSVVGKHAGPMVDGVFKPGGLS